MPKACIKNANVTHGHLGNLAPTGQREESASHHIWIELILYDVALCASTTKMLLNHHFGVRKLHLRAEFHDFLESLRIILDTLGITPNGL